MFQHKSYLCRQRSESIHMDPVGDPSLGREEAGNFIPSGIGNEKYNPRPRSGPLSFLEQQWQRKRVTKL
ncbi:hypothetical protein CsSME_00014805 [Camellia sinensis var. sinensis]